MTTPTTKPAAHMLGPEPTVHETAVIRDSTLGAWTSIGAMTSIFESSIGDYTYLVDQCQVIYSEVGKFCSIASHVRLNPGNHPMERPTQHHMTYRRRAYGFDEVDDEAFFAWRRAAAVTVGHDVWMGHGAIVLPGNRVGTGAVVAAGAVVTHDVAPYTIVAGVPARPIRRRFSEEVEAALMRIAWWDWTRDELEERFDDLRDLDAFLRAYG